MASRILTLSIPEKDDWVYEELEKLKKDSAKVSPIILQAVKEYFLNRGSEVAKEKMKPEWYVPEADYSHLPPKTLQWLVEKFDYKVPEKVG